MTNFYDKNPGGLIGATSTISGIWTLNNIPDISLTSLTFVDLTSAATGTAAASFDCTISSSAQVGDLAIAAYAADFETVTQTTPSGWTYVGNGDNLEYPRMYVYAKILESGDPGSTLSVTPSASEGYSNQIAIFRPNAGASLTSFSTSGFVNDKGPSALSVSLSATGTSPSIALAFLTGRPNQTPSMTWSGATLETVGTTLTTGYIMYSSGSTASHTITSNDTGRQSLSAFYLDIS